MAYICRGCHDQTPCILHCDGIDPMQCVNGTDPAPWEPYPDLLAAKHIFENAGAAKPVYRKPEPRTGQDAGTV